MVVAGRSDIAFAGAVTAAIVALTWDSMSVCLFALDLVLFGCVLALTRRALRKRPVSEDILIADAIKGHLTHVTEAAAAVAMVPEMPATTLLHHAAQHGQDAYLRAVLARMSASSITRALHVADEAGLSPLMRAVVSGHEDDHASTVLISAGSSIAQPGPKARNALFLACLHGAAPTVQRMRDSCVPSVFRGAARAADTCGYTALHACALAGSLDCAAILSDIFTVDEAARDGCTALHVAARAGHAAAVRGLLEMYYTDLVRGPAGLPGAGLPMCRFGCTPLHSACTFMHPDVVTAIVETVPVARLVAQDNDGLHAPHSACQAISTVGSRDTAVQERAVACLVRVLAAGYPATCVDYSDSSWLYLLCWAPGPLQLAAMTRAIHTLRAAGKTEDVAALLRGVADSGWTCAQAAHNTKGAASADVVKYLIALAEEIAPDAAVQDLNAPRSTSNTKYLARRGEHNRIPPAVRDGVLSGDHTMAGVASHLLRISETRAPRVVLLCGAGISTSCGIKDFRSSAGLYRDKRVSQAFSAAAFQENPKVLFDVLRNEFGGLVGGAVRPSKAHTLMRVLKDHGWLARVYTQNIDMLETAVGLASEDLVECHGSLRQVVCNTCGKLIGAKDADDRGSKAAYEAFWATVQAGEMPTCGCGGIARPDVVLFGEPLPRRFNELSVSDMAACDALVVMGTSLVVYPVASLPGMTPPLAVRVLINNEPTGCFQYVTPCNTTPATSASSKSADGGDAAYRDVFFKGLSDEGAEALATALGWGAELAAL